MTAFDDVTLARMHERRSAKWTAYPRDVLPAWIAEMDFPLGPPVKAALRSAVENDDCGYANALDLFEAFAGFMQRRFGWTVDPARVQLIPDVMVGVLELLRVISRPGDGIVINSPVYPPFARTAKEAERTVIDVPLLADANGWALDLAGLERAFAAGTRYYLFCSPHNPIGRVWTVAELTAVAELAKRYDVTVLSDEIHAPMTLRGAKHTVFSTIAEPLGADSVVITAASKAFNIAGLKSAQIVAGSERMHVAMKKMPPGLPYAAAHLGVLASRAAFREGDAWLDELNTYLAGNRALLATLLAEQIPGIRYRPPQAGYLAWLDCGALGIERDLAPFFLERGRIALSRGADFGPAGIPFVRLNIGTSAAMVGEAVARMRAALDR